VTGTGGILRTALEFTRVRITVAVTLTTATGFLLASGGSAPDMLYVLLGVFLLASGSSALNQVQEAGIDSRMSRTRNRPIPTGVLSRPVGLFLAVLLILAGFTFLASVERNAVFVPAMGLLALLWYNVVYTYLKRLTAFAAVPGALIGAIPPLMGFAAAGGDPLDPRILLVAWFFFMWQIPHFWLLLLMCGEQYAAAGLPSLTRLFSRRQLARVTLMWILATAASGLLLAALARADMTWPWKLALTAASIWLALDSLTMLSTSNEGEESPVFRRAFRRINVYALMAMVFLSLSATAG
jgi:protoheme IX farnesyltransferase